MRKDRRGRVCLNYLDEHGKYLRVLGYYDGFVMYAYWNGKTMGETLWQREYEFRRRNLKSVSIVSRNRNGTKYINYWNI